MATEATQRWGTVLCDDLIFTSRITGTARSLATEIKPARSPADLLNLTRETPPSLVIIDLANPGLNLPELLSQFRSEGIKSPFVVAFGSHVDTRTLQAARDAGCNLVLPRSKFVDDLPRKLAGWLEGKPE